MAIYTTTTKFEPRECRALEQAHRNADAVFQPGALELTLLAPLGRLNPLPKHRVVDVHWALRSLLSGLLEQTKASYWRTVDANGVSQRALAEVGRVALIDRATFCQTMAGVRQVQAREVERAVEIVQEALEGFPAEDSDG